MSGPPTRAQKPPLPVSSSHGTERKSIRWSTFAFVCLAFGQAAEAIAASGDRRGKAPPTAPAGSGEAANPFMGPRPGKENAGGPSDPEAGNTTDTINIQVFYETKCPQSLNFLNTTLRAVWSNNELSAAFTISMLPYGDAQTIPAAQVSEGYKFWHPEAADSDFLNVHVCQHGAEECLGNLVQACAIHLLPPSKHLGLIFCMAAKPEYSIEKSSYECMTSQDINITQVADCVRSPIGNQLMTNFAEETQQLKGRQGLPWVMVDKTHLANENQLMQYVCSKLDNNPSSCSVFLRPDDRFQVMYKHSDDAVVDLPDRRLV